MVAAGVKASATTYTALISAYGKQGKVEKAMEIFAGEAWLHCKATAGCHARSPCDTGGLLAGRDCCCGAYAV